MGFLSIEFIKFKTMITLLLALIGILLSIFFSSSEIALISANKLQINVWEKQNVRLSKIANLIVDNKEFYLFCILIGNNLANILTTSFFTVILYPKLFSGRLSGWNISDLSFVVVVVESVGKVV